MSSWSIQQLGNALLKFPVTQSRNQLDIDYIFQSYAWNIVHNPNL